MGAQVDSILEYRPWSHWVPLMTMAEMLGAAMDDDEDDDTETETAVPDDEELPLVPDPVVPLFDDDDDEGFPCSDDHDDATTIRGTHDADDEILEIPAPDLQSSDAEATDIVLPNVGLAMYMSASGDFSDSSRD